MHVPSRTTNLGESEHDTPHLTLVAETIFADNLQLGVAVTFIVRRMISDMKHRQASAQWPGYTYRRADSNAVRVLSVASFTLGGEQKSTARILLTSTRDLVGL